MPAFLRTTIAEFASVGAIMGLHKLTSGLAAAGFDLSPEQHAAWTDEWPRLDRAFNELLQMFPSAKGWQVLLEYPIPGRRKRIDCVLLTDRGIIVIEFKSSAGVSTAAKWQVREYCWNLRDFHRESRGAEIAPIVCSVEATNVLRDRELTFSDRHRLVLDVEVCDTAGLADSILKAYRHFNTSWQCDPERWDKSVIEPAFSVINFAQKLFQGHDVREISHAHADNTDAALDDIRQAIEVAKKEKKRIICFVTGVPGAGKTLVGLNVAYRKEIIAAAGGRVCFASGNQPLLDVLKAALVMNRTRENRDRREIAHDIGAPVQNVHEFARDTLCRDDEQPPGFHVVVFDEAQRVWDAEKLLDGLNKRKRRGQLNQKQIERLLSYGKSEPQLLLSLMERAPDWCVVVALVGGGQEIHDGEAGLAEWGRALAQRTSDWTVWVSSEGLCGGVSSARQKLFAEPPRTKPLIIRRENLHLAVSKRSRRAERYADWVNCVVNADTKAARQISKDLAEFPVFLCRDLRKARDILREYCPKELRYGLLASSGASRLRAEGIEVSPDFRGGISFPDWFLRPSGDIRSSNQLEVAATEFECQGLELDWCCVCWGGDFVVMPDKVGWQFRKLRSPVGKAPQWYLENAPDAQEFVRNKYRVLLTRARIGVVLFVPFGSDACPTAERSVFDQTTSYLGECGATIV